MDKVKLGRGIASYLIPPVGFITYGVIKAEKPNAARGYLIISSVAIGMIVLGAIVRKLNKPKEK